MAVEKSYARLGFFIVVTLVVVLATATLFIQRWRSREVIAMVTYTTENVSGLDISSPVRYRGVPVGRVTDAARRPARDHRRNRLRGVRRPPEHYWSATLAGSGRSRDFGGVFPRLRAQVIGNPVTGEAYLLLDVPQNPPPPWHSGSPRIGPTCRRCPQRCDGTGSAARASGSRRSDAADPRGDRRPGFPPASTAATDSSPTSSASCRKASCRR